MSGEPWGEFDAEMRWQGPNMILMNSEGTGLSLEELRAAVIDVDLLARVAARRVFVSLGRPDDGRLKLTDALGVVDRLEPEPVDSLWGLRASFVVIETTAGRAYENLGPDADLKVGLVRVGSCISGFYLEPR